MTNISLGNGIPRNGLVGEWLLDGNANATVGSNGTATNVSYVNTNRGYQKQAGSFNGSTSQVAIAKTISNYMSVCALVKTTTISDSGIVQNYRAEAGNYGGFRLGQQGTGEFNVTFMVGGTPYNVISSIKSTGVWYNLVGTYDGTTIKLYINGVLAGSTNISGVTTDLTTPYSYIGAGKTWSGSPLFSFNGVIQSARIYNRVLTEAEIQLLYLEGNRKLGPSNIPNYNNLLSGLVYYADMKGTAHNLVDGVAGTVTGATLTTDRFGFSNNAYSFSATTDTITNGATNLGYSLNANYSISTWVYFKNLPTAGNYYYIYRLLEQGSFTTLEIAFDYNAGVRMYAGKGKNGVVNAPSTMAHGIVTGQWYNITVSMSGATSSVYINGTFLYSGTTSGSGTSGTNSWIIAPAGTVVNPFNIGDTFVFSKTLSVDEAKQLYQLTSSNYIYPTKNYDLPNLRDGLVLQLNEQGKDLSGNGNNATLVNSPTIVRQGQSKGLSYNGTNQYSRNANISLATGQSPYTKSCWVKLNSEITAGSFDIFVLNPDGTNNNTTYRISYEYNAGTRRLNIQQYWNYTGGIYVSLPYNITLGTSNWYHITVKWDASNLKLYINGIEVATIASTGRAFGTFSPQSYTHGVSIGSNYDNTGANNYSNAIVFDPRIYTRALSATEIQQLYLEGKGNYIYN